MALQMCNICLGRYPAGEGNTRPGARRILAEELPALSLGAGTTHEPPEVGGSTQCSQLGDWWRLVPRWCCRLGLSHLFACGCLAQESCLGTCRLLRIHFFGGGSLVFGVEMSSIHFS